MKIWVSMSSTFFIRVVIANWKSGGLDWRYVEAISFLGIKKKRCDCSVEKKRSGAECFPQLIHTIFSPISLSESG